MAPSLGHIDVLAPAETAAHANVWSGRRHVEVDDADDDENEAEDGSDEDEYEYDYAWGTEGFDMDEYTAISVWDELSELFIQQTGDLGSYISRTGISSALTRPHSRTV